MYEPKEEGHQARLDASRPAELKEDPVAPMDCSKARGPWGGIDQFGQRRRAAAQSRCSSAGPCPCPCCRCCCHRRHPWCCRSRSHVGCVDLQRWLWQREHDTRPGWCSQTRRWRGGRCWRPSFRRWRDGAPLVPACHGLNVGSTAELAMSSAVLEKRGLRPRRRARTSCESWTGWPTSRRAAALIFSRWQ